MTERRKELWNGYHSGLEDLEAAGYLRRPVVPDGANHNGHLYYLLTESAAQRDELIERLGHRGISCVFHYVPLHSSPAGRRFGRTGTDMSVTDDASARLLRLPLWVGMEQAQVERVVEEIRRALLGSARAPELAPGPAREGTQASQRDSRGDF
jgi:dTDP-4-amino-4,6-dideoxygalactose transaminase